MEQNRLRSKTLWVAVAALVAFVLGNYGLYEAIGLDEGSFQELVNLILVVAISLGIVNNPNEKGVI